MKYKVEVFNNNKHILGEGAFYDPRYEVTSWIDIVGKKLYIIDKYNKLKEVEFKEKIGAALPLKRSNGYVVCAENNLYLYENNEIKVLKSLKGITDGTNRCNDAKADPFGRLWFSTIVDDGLHSPSSVLYCYTNNEIIKMDDDLKLGNGMAWNKDKNKFYLADSAAHKIYSYDYDIDTGYISNRKVLAELYDATPDGMTIDNKDNLIIAIWDGARIEVRSSKAGILKDTINMPTNLITSAAFMDNNLDTLLITSAKLDRTDEFAGVVFKVKTNYKGVNPNYVVIE